MSAQIHAATVLQIIPRLDTGGAERATVEICAALSRAGARSFVLSEGGRMADEVESAGGILVPFPAATKNPARILANGLALARFVRERGIDLVHARSRAPAWSALLAARLTGEAFVTTYHGAYGTSGPAKNLYNSVMARGQRVIANSNYTARLIKARHGTAPDRIRVIHRGVDLARFDPAAVGPGRIRAVREAWGASASDRVVLHAARLTGWKGQRDVIDAASVLGSECRNVLFVLAGDTQGRSAYRSELEERAERGVGARVRIVGHCEDMPAAFAAAHVSVVASTEPEAFGRASAEAQAMGCPVIVTDQGASPETIVPPASPSGGATGWIVPVADPEALAAAVREALSLSKTARDRMGRHARANVERRFAAEQMQYATLQVYDELLNGALAQAFLDARGKDS